MNNNVGYNSALPQVKNVVLGTDGIGSDMLLEAKFAYFRHRDSGGPLGPGAFMRFLQAANEVLHRSFGESFGRVEKGYKADLVVLDYDSPTPLARENVAGHALFGMGSRDVNTVIVNGKIVMENRTFPWDTAPVYAEAQKAAGALEEDGRPHVGSGRPATSASLSPGSRLMRAATGPAPRASRVLLMKLRAVTARTTSRISSSFRPSSRSLSISPRVTWLVSSVIFPGELHQRNFFRWQSRVVEIPSQGRELRGTEEVFAQHGPVRQHAVRAPSAWAAARVTSSKRRRRMFDRMEPSRFFQAS